MRNKYVNQNKQNLDFVPNYNHEDFMQDLANLRDSMLRDGYDEEEVDATLARMNYAKIKERINKQLIAKVLTSYKCRIIDNIQTEAEARNIAKSCNIEQPIIYANETAIYVPKSIVRLNRINCNGLASSITRGIKMYNAGREQKLKMMIGNERVERWKEFVLNKC